MTFAVAWTRRIQNCEELIIASDSRFSGARHMDCVQKVLPLPRSDSFIACAGDTTFTYPLMHLVRAAIGNYERACDRSLDIKILKTHIVKVLCDALNHVTSPVATERRPTNKTEFLFGGYSWQSKGFRVRRIFYDEKRHMFTSRLCASWFGGRSTIAFIGDWKHEGRKRLIKLLRKKRGITPQEDRDFGFDWEPFEVLRDSLREPKNRIEATIGGPPQVLKIYQHMNCRPIGVFWPQKEGGSITISGRSVLDYETPNIWILDPDTFYTSHPYISKKNEEYTTAGIDPESGEDEPEE